MKIEKTIQNRTNKSKKTTMNNITLAEFQHRILRDWVFHPSGALVRDLLAGHEAILRTFLKDRLSMNDLQISRVPNLQGILLQFREPEDYTECRFVFISTKGKEPRMFTCEAAYNLRGSAPLTMVCELVGSSTHRNFGAVANFDLETFLNRLREILEK